MGSKSPKVPAPAQKKMFTACGIPMLIWEGELEKN